MSRGSRTVRIPAGGVAERRLRVVFADDEPIARRGLDRLRRSERDVEVIAGCRNGAEALRGFDRTSRIWRY